MCIDIDLLACSKRVPFVAQFVLEGPNYSAATFRMQVRYLQGDTGTPIISLANAGAGLQGISASYNAAYTHPTTGRVFAATVITVTISKATMTTLAASSPTSGSVVTRYDMIIEPGVGVSEIMPFRGKFIYDPGVTI